MYFVVHNIYGTDWKLGGGRGGGHVPPVPPWFLRLCEVYSSCMQFGSSIHR